MTVYGYFEYAALLPDPDFKPTTIILGMAGTEIEALRITQGHPNAYVVRLPEMHRVEITLND